MGFVSWDLEFGSLNLGLPLSISQPIKVAIHYFNSTIQGLFQPDLSNRPTFL
jgi:hypothetical protein